MFIHKIESDPSIEEKAKQQILNIIELILNLIIVCLAAGKACVDCAATVKGQFVDATIFGYFIVNALIVTNIFIEDQEFHKYWRALVSSLGAVMFAVTGALVLEYVDRFGFKPDDSYVALITAIGVFSFILAILYIVDTILLFKKD